MNRTISRRNFIASTAAAVIPCAIAAAEPRAKGLLAPFSQEVALTTPPEPAGKRAGVIDLSNSPYAKLKTVPVGSVVIQEGFWSKRRKTNLASSIPSMHDELVAHGRMDNFLRLTGRSKEPERGPVFADSDIYKWTEAVGFALQTQTQPKLQQTTEAMIRDVVAVQEPSGYLNTYYVDDRKALRMQYDTQTTGHELYNLGHMLQGAIAYYRATGDRTLLDAGIRFVDGFLLPNYGPGANQKGIVAGHPEIEMALVELYRTTGKRDYLDLAGYILRGDERIPLRRQQISYMYCGIPFTSRTKLEGHAVRAMYACCGATDYYLETGDPGYWKTLNTLWADLMAHQLYVTGGVGARESGEAFGDPYELPNARAYGESCAAIGNMMWNWRMLAASGEARFSDVIERALYNGISSGMSLDGKTYCYRNPLAFDPTGDSSDRHAPDGHIRNPWYDTTCCPPNLERTFASLPGYFYSTSPEGVYVHLYDNSEMDWHLQDGSGLKIRQHTGYPWSGEVEITVTPEAPKEFTVFVRIPGWSQTNAVAVNNAKVSVAQPGEYLAIRRHWSANDTIRLGFDMTPRLLKANPSVSEDLGRVVFQRGPIVFCMEHLDQDNKERGSDLKSYTVKLNGSTTTHFDSSLLDGVLILSHPGYINRSSADLGLYYSADEPVNVQRAPVMLKLIPYFAWSNRDPSSMQVWIPYDRA